MMYYLIFAIATFIVLFIAFLIAYLGFRVGHKIGKDMEKTRVIKHLADQRHSSPMGVARALYGSDIDLFIHLKNQTP